MYLQVSDCDIREYTDQKRLEMSVTEFVEQWTDDSIENNGKSVLYLKDWHFVKVCISELNSHTCLPSLLSEVNREPMLFLCINLILVNSGVSRLYSLPNAAAVF